MAYSFCKSCRKQFQSAYEYCPSCGKPLIHIPDLLPSEVHLFDREGTLVSSNLDEWDRMMDPINRLRTFILMRGERDTREALIQFQAALDQFGRWWKISH